MTTCSHSLLNFICRTFLKLEKGSSVSNAMSNLGFFLRASTETSIAIIAVSPHMWYWFPDSGSEKQKECIGAKVPAELQETWFSSLVKKSRGTEKTALTSAGFGQGQNDSSIKPTTGVTSKPLCEKTCRWVCDRGGRGAHLSAVTLRSPPCSWSGTSYTQLQPHRLVDRFPPLLLSTPCAHHLCH